MAVGQAMNIVDRAAAIAASLGLDSSHIGLLRLGECARLPDAHR